MIHVVTDSTASLPPELVEECGIHVVPQIVNFGGETFRAGVDLSIDEFYRRLAAASDLPTTSQPSAGDFSELFARLTADGSSVLAIVVSNELSGTYLSAQGARGMLPDADIHVIDSRSVSAPLGFMVVEAARMARAGADIEAIKARVAQMGAAFHIYFLVDTLEYLRRGGRIGGAAALLGTALRLKPILSIQNGRVEPFERVRTKAKATARLMDLVRLGLDPGRDGKIYLAMIHGDAYDRASALHAELVQEFRPAETMLIDLTPAIATHSGPGVLAVAYYQDP
jgi:DegV family protein with EDD domain